MMGRQATPGDGTTPGAGHAHTFNAQVLQRVMQLLRSPHPATGVVMSGREVTVRAQELGYKLSASYVLGLRAGARKSVSLETLGVIAEVFEVDPSYFTSTRDSKEHHSDRALDAALSNGDVRRVALRAASLSPRARRRLAAIIEEMTQDAPEQSGDSTD